MIKKSTLFVVVAIVVLVMVAVYAYQLTSMGRIECYPYNGFYCEVAAIGACYGGFIMAFRLDYSFCYFNSCEGYYTIYCDTADGLRRIGFICDDNSNSDCFQGSN